MLATEPSAERVKVKRDGPRGWHWIAAAHFDPTKHELIDAPAASQVAPEPEPEPEPAKRKRGRPRKVDADNRMEAIHGNR